MDSTALIVSIVIGLIFFALGMLLYQAFQKSKKHR